VDDPRATIQLEPFEPPDKPATDTLEIGGVLGRGAMGEVLTAFQPLLSRHVAVKRAHDDPSGWCATQLRLEARATGLLEHPNIVPVHDLREGSDGPWMVMKQIAGDLWIDLIDHPQRCAAHLEGDDVLAFHLGVLGGVCRALSFAHRRGVLHRDVKPSNVMIGGHGEVYLLDWGIAVGLREGLGLPLAAHQRQPAGSPAFMAPEMARGDGPALTERSDVYLVGTTLFYVLTGRPYHEGATVADALAAARAGLQRPVAGVPAELARLVERCTRPEPADRLATVDEVRIALADFLRHRGAARVVEGAEQRMKRVRDLVAEAVASGEPSGEVRTLAAEARFGYRQGLSEWPEHGRAQLGLVLLQKTMVRYELFSGNADAAADLLDAIGGDRELQSELDALRAAQSSREQAAGELERRLLDEAPGLSARSRMVLGALLGVLTAAMLFGMGWWDRAHGITWPHVLVGVSVFSVVALFGCLVSLLRENNVFGRMHVLVTAGIAAAVWVHWVTGWWLGASIHTTMTLSAVLAGAILITAGGVHDRMSVVAGAVYLLALPGLLLWPHALYEVFGVVNGLSFGTYAALSYASGRNTG